MFSNGISKSAEKRIELAVAQSQERLLAEHVNHALELVALVSKEVNFSSALDIYVRLLRLDETEAASLKTRAFAILGEEVDQSGSGAWKVVDDTENENGNKNRSWFGQVTGRMKGRKNEELRKKVEFIAARTEIAILSKHVDNALHFADFLKGEIEERKAIEIYLDALDVRESVAEITYYQALARLSRDVIPKFGEGRNALRESLSSGNQAREDEETAGVAASA